MRVTIRAHIYVVNSLCLAVLCFMLSCVKSTPMANTIENGQGIVKLDTNNDGKPDVWQTFKSTKENEKSLIKEEFDLNHDQKIDVLKEYQNDQISKIQYDFDFDENFDQTEFYLSGLVEKITSSHGFNKQIDTWKFYEKGALKRIEKDSNSDGKADLWTYYENGAITRVGKDFNHDGVIDFWQN